MAKPSCAGTERCSVHNAIACSTVPTVSSRVRGLTIPNPGQAFRKWISLPGPWTGFYDYGRSTRKHRMDLVLTFCNHTISGDSSDDIGRFFLPGGSMTQRVNVTGRKVTSERTTFTTAGFASAKGFGGYGNCLTSQAAFTSGQVDRAKAKRIMRERKSPRASEQVSFDLYRGGRGTRVQRLRAGAASTRD